MARSRVLTDLVLRISSDSAELVKGMKKANSQLANFQKQVKNVALSVAAGFGAQEILSAAQAAGEYAQKVEGVRNAFDKLDRPADLLRQITKATRGSISEFDALQASVLAQDFNIQLESLPKLLEFAAVQAQRTGQEVDFLAKSIITGLGRKSVLILDNLGLSSLEIQERFKQTGNFVQAVTDIIDQKLSKSGTIVEDTAIAAARANANWKNIQESIGNVVNVIRGGFFKAFNNLIDYTKEADSTLQDLNNEFNIEINALKNGNLSANARAKLIQEINTKYKDYLPNLISEKDSLEDIDILQKAVNENILNRILLERQQKEITEAINNRLESEEKLLNNQIALAKAQERLRISSDPQEAKQIEIRIQQLTNAQELNRITVENSKKRYDEIIDSYEALKKELGIVDQATTNLNNSQFANIDLSKIRINQIENEIKLLQELESQYSKANDLVQEYLENANQNLNFDIDSPDPEATPEANAVFDKLLKKQEQLTNKANEYKQLIANANRDLFTGIGEGLGDLLTGSQTIVERFFQFIGNLATQFGKLLIAWGTASEAFKKSIETFQGIPAIVSGIALIAAGAAIKNFANAQKLATGGFVNSDFQLVGEQGPELVSLNRGSFVYNNSRTRDILAGQNNIGSASVKFIIEKDTLTGILEQDSRQRSYF